MLRSLVGSEMCIRDRVQSDVPGFSLSLHPSGCMPCRWADPGTSLLVRTPHTSLSLPREKAHLKFHLPPPKKAAYHSSTLVLPLTLPQRKAEAEESNRKSSSSLGKTLFTSHQGPREAQTLTTAHTRATRSPGVEGHRAAKDTETPQGLLTPLSQRQPSCPNSETPAPPTPVPTFNHLTTGNLHQLTGKKRSRKSKHKPKKKQKKQTTLPPYPEPWVGPVKPPPPRRRIFLLTPELDPATAADQGIT